MALTAAVTLYLPVTPPFDFEHSLSVLDGPAACASAHVRRGAELLTGGYAPDPFVARLRADGQAGVVASVTWLDDAGDTDAVVDHLDGFLSLSDDLTPLYDATADDPAFADVVADRFGYHPVRFGTPFEAACWAVLSRRRPTALAAARRRALVDAAGTVARVDGSDVDLFPTPSRVLEADGDVCAALGDDAFPVLAAAGAFAAGDLDGLDASALVDRIRDVPGFDRAAATLVARRGFGRTSLLPATTHHIRPAVASLYGLDDAATDEDLDRLSDPYGEFRGDWAHYVRVWSRRAAD